MLGIQDNVEITFCIPSISLPELPKVISSKALDYSKLPGDFNDHWGVLETLHPNDYGPISPGVWPYTYNGAHKGFCFLFRRSQDFEAKESWMTSFLWTHRIFVLNLCKVGLFLSINLLRLDNRNRNPIQEGNRLELWELKSNNTACSDRISTKKYSSFQNKNY